MPSLTRIIHFLYILSPLNSSYILLLHSELVLSLLFTSYWLQLPLDQIFVQQSFCTFLLSDPRQGHYVATHANGLPITKTSHKGAIYDEIVVGQESQALPAYILELDAAALVQFMEDHSPFKREVVDDEAVLRSRDQ